MVVHPRSHGVPRAPRYSGYGPLLSVFGYGALTPSGRPSHAVPLTCRRFAPSIPRTPLSGRAVWPPPRSLATTCGISVDFFSSPYLDVSVRAVPRARLSFSPRAGRVWPCRVSPFGYLRIVAYVPLPAAFRSLSRPSSAPDAKASPLRSL